MTADKNFAPIPSSEWPEELNHLRSGFAEQLNVYRVMAHHPALLNAWGALRQHVVVDNSLGPVLSEAAILRAAFHSGSAYEQGHHIVRARACNMDDQSIQELVTGATVSDARYRSLATAVDRLASDGRLDPSDISAIIDLAGKAGVFDVIATVGFYTTLAFILNSFDTPLDQDVALALARTPLAGLKGLSTV
jgi:4-carboxymuconolactone decarboxylase